MLLTDRLVVGDRYGLTDFRVVLHFVDRITCFTVFPCIVLSVLTTVVRTVRLLVRVFIVVSLFMWSSHISFVSYVICDSNMYLVTALGFNARKLRSIVLVITDLNTLT